MHDRLSCRATVAMWMFNVTFSSLSSVFDDGSSNGCSLPNQNRLRSEPKGLRNPNQNKKIEINSCRLLVRVVRFMIRQTLSKNLFAQCHSKRGDKRLDKTNFTTRLRINLSETSSCSARDAYRRRFSARPSKGQQRSHRHESENSICWTFNRWIFNQLKPTYRQPALDIMEFAISEWTDFYSQTFESGEHKSWIKIESSRKQEKSIEEKVSVWVAPNPARTKRRKCIQMSRQRRAKVPEAQRSAARRARGAPASALACPSSSSSLSSPSLASSYWQR